MASAANGRRLGAGWGRQSGDPARRSPPPPAGCASAVSGRRFAASAGSNRVSHGMADGASGLDALDRKSEGGLKDLGGSRSDEWNMRLLNLDQRRAFHATAASRRWPVAEPVAGSAARGFRHRDCPASRRGLLTKKPRRRAGAFQCAWCADYLSDPNQSSTSLGADVVIADRQQIEGDEPDLVMVLA
jgi:hypothetical protein